MMTTTNEMKMATMTEMTTKEGTGTEIGMMTRKEVRTEIGSVTRQKTMTKQETKAEIMIGEGIRTRMKRLIRGLS